MNKDKNHNIDTETRCRMLGVDYKPDTNHDLLFPIGSIVALKGEPTLKYQVLSFENDTGIYWCESTKNFREPLICWFTAKSLVAVKEEL